MSTLTVHQLVPNQERRAAQEASRAGVKFKCPKQRIDGKAKKLLHGYALLDGHVREAQYIRRAIGQLESGDLRALYDAARAETRRVRKIKLRADAPFTVGEKVEILRGAFENFEAVITEIQRKRVTVEVTIMGKPGNPVQTTVANIRRRPPKR
jgi:transcription antitermination factor NusG